MNCCLYYQLVKQSQIKDKNALVELIKTFNPLLNKYSNKLNYDGAKSDLIIEFIKIINKIPIKKSNMKNDKYIVGYINTCIKNKFFKLRKLYFNILNKEIELNLNLIGKYEENNVEDKLILKYALLNLSKYQRKIIVEEFVQDKSEAQISKQLKVSRQAINKTKKAALKNMRSYLIKEHYV